MSTLWFFVPPRPSCWVVNAAVVIIIIPICFVMHVVLLTLQLSNGQVAV